MQRECLESQCDYAQRVFHKISRCASELTTLLATANLIDQSRTHAVATELLARCALGEYEPAHDHSRVPYGLSVSVLHRQSMRSGKTRLELATSESLNHEWRSIAYPVQNKQSHHL